MIIRRQIALAVSLSRLIAQSLITHKFYNGQGGELQFDLTKRKYQVQLQTIWEDYCLLEIQGLTGVQNFVFSEQQEISQFHDKQLKENLQQTISVKIKVPEDYTLNGNIYGNIKHISGQVGNNMRSKPFSINVLGNDHSLSLGKIKSEDVNIKNEKGSVYFSGLTVQKGFIFGNKLISQKIMTSNHITLDFQSLDVKSLLMPGSSKAVVKSKQAKIQSIEGDCSIESDKLNILRLYGKNNTISLRCKQIEGKIGIESGSGTIQFQNETQAAQNFKRVELGRIHKGRLQLRKNKIDIV